MVKLQNNFTTPEQSKRLLELGVPADSADMYYKQYSEAVVWVGEFTDVPQGKTFYIHEPILRHINPEGTYTCKDGERIDLSGKVDELRKTDIPCWSVGRLIEIIGICAGMECINFETFVWMKLGFLEKLIMMINDFVLYNKIDFSKLEE